MSKIALIDGNSLMFRSYYATAYTGNLMKTSTGIFTNALFGFCNMFTKIVEENYDYIFVAFDAGKKTFRHQQYDEYKGGRKPLPDELRMQIPIIKDYLDTLPIKHYETFDFEADDLIASTSTLFNENDEVFVITGDKDLLQLVNSNITVLLTKKGIQELDDYNKNNFKEKMGFEPLQILDYKGLVGDSSDNLPGIKGVGEKTAIKLINQYNSLEGIYENINELTGKTKELFVSGEEQAKKCKYLATLRKDAPLPFDKEELKVNEINITALKDFYLKYEFTSLLKRLEKIDVISKSEVVEESTHEFELALKKEDFNDGFIATEVFKANYYNGEFLGISLNMNDKNYFFSASDIKNNPLIKEYLEDENYKKYTFDVKMLYFVLNRLNIKLKGVVFDLLLASYIINPSFASDDFKGTLSNFTQINLPFYDTIYGANSKMTIPEKNIYMEYSISKALLIKEYYKELLDKIKEIDCMYLLEVEMKLSKVLAEMEEDGLLIDVNKLNKVGEEFVIKSNEIANRIYEIAGEEFNINSPKQLGDILFEKLHLPHGKKNKTGYSTSSDVLEWLKTDYEIASLILDYRAYTKLLSTYIAGLNEVKDENNMIHPLYKQALTVTGRLSSIEPNIQNMPIRTERGQVIREAFISRFKDGVIFTCDYSQVELRVLANMSKDPVMVESFNSGIDIHKKTASELYEVDVNDVTKEMRRTAKAINFGIIYGMSSWGLSDQIGISPLEAQMFINKYFDTFKVAKATLDKFVSDAKELGYSKTIFNRRRYIPEVSSSNKNLAQFGERTAMNSPIQGSAADIIKIAMISISEAIKEEGLESLLIAQVHDELVFDVKKDELEKVEKIVKEKMEGVLDQDVKLVAEGGSGKTWFEAK